MSTDYFIYTPLTAFALARSSDVDSRFQAVETGLGTLPARLLIQQNRITFASDTGAANALVVALPQPIPAYTTGLRLVTKVAATNTGAATINVDGLGVKSIKRGDGTALLANDLLAGQMATLDYDGVDFRLQSATVSDIGSAGIVARLAGQALGTGNLTVTGTATASTGIGIGGAAVTTPLSIQANGGGSILNAIGSAGNLLIQAGGVNGLGIISQNNSSTQGFIIGTSGGSTATGQVVRLQVGGADRIVLDSAGAAVTGALSVTGSINGMQLKSGSGGSNVGLGLNAAANLTTGLDNVLVGYNAGIALTTGSDNIAVGRSALSSAQTSSNNVAVGYAALDSLTTGTLNVALGWAAGGMTTGNYNTAIGYSALNIEATGSFNTALGFESGSSQNGASQNTLLGHYTGFNLTTGGNNVFVGHAAGGGVTTGSSNTVIGSNLNGLAAGLTGTLIIGAGQRQDIVHNGTLLRVGGSLASFNYPGSNLGNTDIDNAGTGGAARIVGYGGTGAIGLLLTANGTSSFNGGGVSVTGDLTATGTINGVTLDNAAWTAYTPTVTAGSGTFTTLGTVTARYKRIGKTVHFNVNIPITTNGTAASSVNFTLPFVVAAFGAGNQVFVGRESQATGAMLYGHAATGGTTVPVNKFDGTYPGGDSRSISVSGTYEIA